MEMIATIDEVLDYYDAPILLTARVDARLFLGMAVPKEDFLLVETTPEAINRFKTREVDLRSIFCDPAQARWYRGRLDGSAVIFDLFYTALPAVPESCLPQPGYFLDVAPPDRATAAQPRLNYHQAFRLRGLLVSYMKNRFFSGLCPYDSNTVGVGDAFSESLPEFPNSVIDWQTGVEEQKVMFEKTCRLLGS
jgi:hypothetical protein